MCSSMMSLPPCALNAPRSGSVESMRAETSRTRLANASGRYLRGSKIGSWAKMYFIAPAPKIQAMPLVGEGGRVGGDEPSHQARQPPVGPKDGLASPETPQPGYSVTPLASVNGKS